MLRSKIHRGLILFLFIIGAVNYGCAQNNNTPDKKLSEEIDNLLKRDSINELIILELKKQVQSSKDTATAVTINSPNKTNPVGNLPFTVKERGEGKTDSLLYSLIFAFLAGILSLVTPCVFPMIPLTVTFFANGSINRGQAIRKAIAYGTSIVLIFTIIGLVFGAALANVISTHWLPNIIFFSIFIFFGLSFLGMFDITLPSAFVNKVDRQADKGGYYGIFFMALTLVLVSFSCTVPIVGTLNIEYGRGEFIKPVLVMLTYSTAFAIPFTLFAIFPSWLNTLPKSGGWLNVIKVSLGIIEIAFAFKFLSVPDLVYHWNILDREIYIAIWIVLAILLGVYYLGHIKLPHDSITTVTSVPRFMLATGAFVFAVYLMPGMFGAPLKMLAGYLPPMSTHDFDLPGNIREYSSIPTKKFCEEPKYNKNFNMPHGLKGYFEYEQALACAREKKLPLFIDFTGHACVNCRKMEYYVWSDPEVLKILKNDYVIVELYVDDRTPILDSTGAKSGKTLGEVNYEIQASKFNTYAQPYYVLLDPMTEKKLSQSIGYDPSIPNFIDFLEEGKKNFRILNQNK
jgi:thiol:disulfide interchange protein